MTRTTHCPDCKAKLDWLTGTEMWRCGPLLALAYWISEEEGHPVGRGDIKALAECRCKPPFTYYDIIHRRCYKHVRRPERGIR